MKTLFTQILSVAFILFMVNAAQAQCLGGFKVLYNAAIGINGLVGASKVYMHSGCGINPGAAWTYVVGNWGQDDGIGEMTQDGIDLWYITINDPIAYYNYAMNGPLPNGASIYRIGIVFRNADGTAEGRDDNNSDIFLDFYPDGSIVSSFYGVYAEYINPFFNSNANISGVISFDVDGNCNTTSGNTNVSFIPVKLYSNNTYLQASYTNSLGKFGFNAPQGTYTVKVDTNYIPYKVLCPASGVNTVTINALNQVDSSLSFRLACKDLNDVRINNIVDFGLFFPGQIGITKINAGLSSTSAYLNNCTTLPLQCKLTVSYQGSASFTSVLAGTPQPSSVIGNTIVWNTINLTQSMPNIFYGLMFNTDTTATMDDTLCLTANIEVLNAVDQNLSNNQYYICLPIINSYDPNMKESSPPGYTYPNDWINYTIHFQNTGNAPAINIKLIDTLNNGLDWNSFQYTHSSHQNTIYLNSQGIMTIKFPDIWLIDSTTNEEASKGYFSFRIKTKQNLPYNTVVSNSASIYFDYNAPVKTNTVTNSYPKSYTSVQTNNSAVSTLLYPNPATDYLYFNNTVQGAQIKIYSFDGRLIRQISKPGTNSIYVGDLSAGIYVMAITTDRETIVTRFVK